MERVMIIGKGSLFLARLTNLSDGASFVIEKPGEPRAPEGLTKEDIRETLLDALAEIAEGLRKA
jgi:betaine reductase